MSALHHHLLLAAALQNQYLTRAFVHDSRTDLILYDGAWRLVPNTGAGSPYRAQDTTILTDMSVESTLTLRFTSDGQADEFVSVHAVAESNAQPRLLLNGQDVTATYLTRNARFYSGSGDLFEYPMATLPTQRGANTLVVVLPALPAGTSASQFYFDGFGLNLRGGPLPV